MGVVVLLIFESVLHVFIALLVFDCVMHGCYPVVEILLCCMGVIVLLMVNCVMHVGHRVVDT